jgi:hypothetical protein
MAAGYQELFIEQGADYNTTITLDDVDGTPYDLTGYTGKSQIRKSYYSANATAQFTITINNPTNGELILGLSSSNTANIAAGRYVYDVLIKDTTANTVTRVLEGIVNVLPRVTVF